MATRRSGVPTRREAGHTLYVRRRRKGSSTIARVLVAAIWIAVVLPIILVGGDLFAFLLIVFGVLALHELYMLLRPVRPVVLAGFVGMIGLVLAAAYGDQYQMVLVSAGAVALTFAGVLGRASHRHATLSMAATLLGVFWIGLALAHAMLLRNLDHGDGLLIDVLVGTFIGDTGAYFGGRMWGTTQLAPRVSPNKTVEGLIAGFVTGTLAVWFAGLYQDWLPGLDALLIGACVAAATPLGDLFESLVKRDLRVKDSGRFFGEHGGVLDRLDAAFFTVVVGYYAARAVGFT